MGSNTITVSFSPKDTKLFNLLLYEAGVHDSYAFVGRHIKAFLYAYTRMLEEGSTFKVELTQSEDGGFTATIPTLIDCVVRADTLDELSTELSEIVRYYLCAELDTSELPEEEI